MVKIQIQFNESDYKVYYEYCERYYQIHDIVRKKTILTFLDLFCNGVLPVEEEEISQAHLVLSQKCEELKKASYYLHGSGDTTISLQLRACADILVFCKDLEKMYRLFLKQGIVANYHIILGTFSRVIEDAKNTPISVIYDLNGDLVESLSNPLTEIIRKRLGKDPHWQSVLHELTAISARFNQISSGPKFDLEIVKLVSPAVVSHFSQNVDTSEIMSAVTAYFDDSELEEFEVLLNRTYDLLENDLDAVVDWKKISGPLDEISRKIAEQKEQWTWDHSRLSGHSLLTPGADTMDFGNAPSHAGALSPSFHGMPRVNERKVFEIALSPSGATHVESPLTVYPSSDAMDPPLLAPYFPLIIGFSVILLFIFGSVILSGGWDPLANGNATNITFSPNGTTKVTVAPVPTVIAIKTTVKPTATPAPNPVTAAPTPQSYTSADIGNHLVEIAFGPDTNVIQKPAKDLVWISAMGADTESDDGFILSFIDQFNDYSTTTKLSTNLDLSSQADISLVLLPEKSLEQINPVGATTVFRDFSNGTLYVMKTNENTYINSDLRGNVRNRWILRAILLNLGFFGETSKYPDSLFYTGANNAGNMSAIDLKALQMMFGKKVKNGMTKSTVKTLV
jgi:hypothetical protein